MQVAILLSPWFSLFSNYHSYVAHGQFVAEWIVHLGALTTLSSWFSLCACLYNTQRSSTEAIASTGLFHVQTLIHVIDPLMDEDRNYLQYSYLVCSFQRDKGTFQIYGLLLQLLSSSKASSPQDSAKCWKAKLVQLRLGQDQSHILIFMISWLCISL